MRCFKHSKNYSPDHFTPHPGVMGAQYVIDFVTRLWGKHSVLLPFGYLHLSFMRSLPRPIEDRRLLQVPEPATRTMLPVPSLGTDFPSENRNYYIICSVFWFDLLVYQVDEIMCNHPLRWTKYTRCVIFHAEFL